MFYSCQEVEVCSNEVIAMTELVIHYLANRNHVPIIAALQKNNSSERKNPVFYSEVIFFSRNMDLNNKSNESVVDQR